MWAWNVNIPQISKYFYYVDTRHGGTAAAALAARLQLMMTRLSLKFMAPHRTYVEKNTYSNSVQFIVEKKNNFLFYFSFDF